MDVQYRPKPATEIIHAAWKIATKSVGNVTPKPVHVNATQVPHCLGDYRLRRLNHIKVENYSCMVRGQAMNT
jgi:hypothetical protein